MAEFEPDKFIVINRKHLNPKGYTSQKVLQTIDDFNRRYNIPDHRYLVCNQDEPYAEEVKRVILEGEKEKERIKFTTWKIDIQQLADSQNVNLSTDDEEVLFNHFKSGTTPEEFLNPNSIPW